MHRPFISVTTTLQQDGSNFALFRDADGTENVVFVGERGSLECTCDVDFTSIWCEHRERLVAHRENQRLASIARAARIAPGQERRAS